MKKPAKYLILVWYSCRINIFHLCKIKHYYTYYSRFDAVIPEQRMDQLKRRTTIPLLIRQLTHKVIKPIQEKLERTSDPIRIKPLRNHISTLVKKAIKGPTFFDTYYSSFEIDANPIIKEILSNIKTFLSSKRLSCIKDINIAVRK